MSLARFLSFDALTALTAALLVASIATWAAMRTIAADEPARRRTAMIVAALTAFAGTIVLIAASPFADGWHGVALSVLIGFLAAAVATDFDSYQIPDIITAPGTIAGVGFGLAAVGPVQPLLADWRDAITIEAGPTVPDWIVAAPHWHGLAVAVAGGLTGLLVTLALRCIASAAMQQEAMGTGDATLMMMAGSFIGWQATLVALLLAPLIGLVAAVLVRVVTGRTFVAFGPYLALAVWLLLVAWEPIWQLRRPDSQPPGMGLIFSDLPLVAGTVVFIVGGSGLLLWLLRRLR